MVYTVTNQPAAVITLGANAVMPIELFYSQNSSSKFGAPVFGTGIPVNQLNATIPGAIGYESAASAVSTAAFPLAAPTIGAAGYATNVLAGKFFQQGNGLSNINPSGWNNPSFVHVFFDGLGRLNFLAPTVANGITTYPLNAAPQVAIDCKEVPYRALFDFTSTYGINISKLRIIATPANGGTQFQNTLNNIKYTFLGGLQKNPVSPTSFQSPFNQQNNIVDVVNYGQTVDKNRGILYGINMNEVSGTIVFFADGFTAPR